MEMQYVQKERCLVVQMHKQIKQHVKHVEAIGEYTHRQHIQHQ